MLPLQQAYETRHAIVEYLRSTFRFKEHALQAAFDDFVDDRERGMFKGPYVSLKLPFQQAEDGGPIPLDVKPNFPPYRHQQLAFGRLSSSEGRAPLSTLITTGTSSGKTECFLYPILDHCHRMADRPGIKVVILYPMNALATDQAKRMAEAIWSDDRLKGRIRAGLFIGEGKNKRQFPTEMGPTQVVENRDSIVDNPPDILLTNFKMLDYGLMKGRFHNLWHYNLKDPGLLRYLVLDELHTYDGAQGTDVANLIRRLKLKLSIPPGTLCAVGTSATLGAGPDAAAQLRSYASKVFGEVFDEGSVVTEHRLGIDDVFEAAEVLEDFLPRLNRLSDSRMGASENYADYIARQKQLWQIDPAVDAYGLTEELKGLRIVRDLVSVTRERILPLPALLRRLAEVNPMFDRLPEQAPGLGFHPREEVVNSLLALISDAKRPGIKPTPFLYLQVQLWIRELSGIRRFVTPEPRFGWSEDAGPDAPSALPAYFCRECGSSGWTGYKTDPADAFLRDADEVNRKYFENDRNVYFINTEAHPPVEEYEPDTRIDGWLDPMDLSILNAGVEGSVRFIAVRKFNERRALHVCPECGTENSLSIIGTRVATLASVTVGQVLASDLDPRPERDRKVLAFTNSVQDAAHQAAFIEARNYRFTFRASLQKVLNVEGLPMDLEALRTRFLAYWKAQSDPTGAADPEAFYHRFFPSDLKGSMNLSYDYRVGGVLTPAFRTEFDLRMGWEVFSEFGLNAGIGRTLEKTGTSACRLDEKRLGGLYAFMREWLEANLLGQITEQGLNAYVNGIVHRMRMRGAIAHPYLEKYRQGPFEPFDLNWRNDGRHFLHRYFAKRSRLPKLLVTNNQARGRADSTHIQRQSWFLNYFKRSFPLATDHFPILNDFHARLVDAMVEAGVLDKNEAGPTVNHAILPDALIADRRVNRYACDTCGSILTVAANDTLTPHTACLDYACKGGRYVMHPLTETDYYRLVYNRNRSPRIHATEHTGLLERLDRERKERDFKERPAYDSLNTIVATSTLEMGIDIGTLNTVLNNSVPRTTANYLQRIGRAGRSSGSALVANLALNEPHDLFHYEEPMDMMDGEVNTPGCFLEAKDILLRHYLAFCIDSWAMLDPSLNNLPRNFLLMGLARRSHDDTGHFHMRLARFMEERKAALLDRFTAFYATDLEDPSVLAKLRSLVEEGVLTLRLKENIKRVKEEYRYIQDKMREIEGMIAALGLAKTDPGYLELASEKRAFYGMKRQIDQRGVAEHLTDTGLLPNYAFPETGVRLQSTVRAFQPPGSDAIPRDASFEFVRSAAVAIKELAPGNVFVAMGYRHRVSGIDVSDWREVGVLVEKRFCSQCDHIAMAVMAVESECPKCGDNSWASDRNRHRFLRLGGVRSSETRRKATLSDASDERDHIPFHTSRHILFGPRSFGGAYALREASFGIEYRSEAEILTVNLGMGGYNEADDLVINGHADVPRHGFVTCRHCGRSTSTPKMTAALHERYTFHHGYCRHREKVYEGRSDEVFEEVFLYRSMTTEAIKVLLPVQEMDTAESVELFKAGIELGLKKYFKGMPQHIETTDHRKFNPATGRFDRYIVLYDSIPGGTGYIARLFGTEAFTRLLQLSYDAIHGCGCRNRGRDGCYRCILAYSNRYVHASLRRSAAERLFAGILGHAHAWGPMLDTPLSGISAEGRIEESELETRFIRVLRSVAHKKEAEGWQFSEELIDGVYHYRLTTKDEGVSRTYHIQPQVELAATYGLAVPTRADFLIRLIRVEGLQGEDAEREAIETALPIAVYLDGHAFHASFPNVRIRQDLEVRSSIAVSRRLRAWTLTWGDLDRFEQADPRNRKDTLAVSTLHASTLQQLRRTPHRRHLDAPLVKAANSMDRLLALLTPPLNADHPAERACALMTLQPAFGRPSVNESEIDAWLERGSPVPDAGMQATDTAAGGVYLFPEPQCRFDGFIDTAVAVHLRSLSILAAVHLQDITATIDRSSWESFWQLFNLIQEEAVITYPDEAREADDTPIQDLGMLLANYDPSVHEVLRILHEAGIPVDPDGGFSVPSGGRLAEAHLGIEDRKVFFGALSEESKALFLALGYRECSVERFQLSDLEAL